MFQVKDATFLDVLHFGGTEFEIIYIRREVDCDFNLIKQKLQSIKIAVYKRFRLMNYAFAKAKSQQSHSPEKREELYQNIYWKKGGIDMKSGEKTLTLKQFEERYTPRFLRIASEVEKSNLYQRYLSLPESEQTDDLKNALRMLDQNANINWLLMHMGAAHRYLRKEGKAVQATGGTNWKTFLPPSFQKISFFPSLWTTEEHENWGKQWVDHHLNTK